MEKSTYKWTKNLIITPNLINRGNTSLMNKPSLLLLVLAFFGIWNVAYPEEVPTRELMEMLKSLQKQVANQQREIDALNKKLNNKNEDPLSLKNEVGFKNEQLIEPLPDSQERRLNGISPEQPDLDKDILQTGYAVIKEVAGVELGKTISGLSLKGDARFRYEARDRERNGSEDSRDRFRIRLRLGAVWHNLDDSWEIGVGLATGSTGNRSATSTNQSFSEDGVFQTNEINLDYAYARHSWENAELVIGQQVNPWKKSTSFMMWDSDVRPVGISGKYHIEDLVISAGVFDVLGAASDDNSEALMVAGQVGYKAEIDTMTYLLAGGIWHFNDSAYEAVNNFVSRENSRHAGPTE